MALRRRLASSTTALVLGICAIVVLVADIPLDALVPRFEGWAEGVPFLPFACVGLVVARRQPHNPIGWLLIAVALAMGISYAAGPYAVLAFRDGHPGLPLARPASALVASWGLLLALLPLPILLFPGGRLPSRRWRWPLRMYLALGTLLLIAITAGDAPALYARHVHVDSLGEFAKSGGSGFGVGGCRSPRCSSSPMRRCRSRSSDASCSASAEQSAFTASSSSGCSAELRLRSSAR